VNPCVTHLQALLAAARVWFDISNLIHMRAFVHVAAPCSSLSENILILKVYQVEATRELVAMS
jgi:hypothetical protein